MYHIRLSVHGEAYYALERNYAFGFYLTFFACKSFETLFRRVGGGGWGKYLFGKDIVQRSPQSKKQPCFLGRQRKP